MPDKALQWISNLLRQERVPYLVCGGLAAIAYGSGRPLNDIDLFVPGEHFHRVVDAGRPFISKPAMRYTEAPWDLEYVQFKYANCKIEVGNVEGAKIWDAIAARWADLSIDFSRSQVMRVFGVKIPVMAAEDLLRYKAMLARPVDREDIEAVKARA